MFEGTKKGLWWWVDGVWKRKLESEERGLSMSEEDEEVFFVRETMKAIGCERRLV